VGISAVELSDTFTSIVAATGPSVVRVQGGRRRAISGIAWSERRVVTVAHAGVRERAWVGVEGAEVEARVLGRDEATDIALLEVDHPLTPARLEQGPPLTVGQVVLRLGRPGETVRATSGIVSALGQRPWRAGRRDGTIERYLEADAPHQPGFSGGPLVGLDGAVLGMTTTGLVHGTAITIPTATLRRVVDALAAHGRVWRSHLGLAIQPVRLPEPIREATREDLGLLVLAVAGDGPAAKAGVQYGDTLLHLGDASVRTLEDLSAFLHEDREGQAVPVTLWRNGQVQTLELTVGARSL
jgi:S1-C subfamily serine protease